MPTETIDETTMGSLGEVPVAMGNMTHDTYLLPDGSQSHGLVCALVLPDGPVFVGLGSEVALGDSTWRVTAIESPEGELGWVTLEELAA